MATSLPVEVISQQTWLEPIAERLQPAIAQRSTTLSVPRAQRFYTALGWGIRCTSSSRIVPLGSWAAAAVFDLLDITTGNTAVRRAADSAITVGLFAATVTAMTGLADWSKIGGGESRRIGLAHGLLNVTATASYLTSLCLRRAHSRRAGRRFAFFGLMVSGLCRYLGGHLVYKKKIVSITPRTIHPLRIYPGLGQSRSTRERIEARQRRWHARACSCAKASAYLPSLNMRPPWRTAIRGKVGRHFGKVPVARVELFTGRRPRARRAHRYMLNRFGRQDSRRSNRGA
jgi:uncharacterized membrane protein